MYLNKQQQQMLDHAMEYADRGWHILPVSKMTQKPLIRDWANKATTDRSRVISWFSDYPAMNIGILTGEKSGFWAVDLQIRSDARGFDSLKCRFDKDFAWDLKKWLVSATASGGFHFFIQWDPEHPVTTRSEVLPGVNTIGNGNQIIVAPSIQHIDNKWVDVRWNNPNLPICPFDKYKWILEYVTLEEKSAETSAFTADDMTQTMSGLQDGDRAEMLRRYVGHLKAQGIDVGLALGFIEAACERAKPPFDKDKASDMVRHAYAVKGQETRRTTSMTTFKLEQGKLKKRT